MSKYKIGITEAGDAGIDLTWENKLDSVDGAVVITKHVTPEFFQAVLRHPRKLIVHATCTGYGGTVLEPNVPTPDIQLEMVRKLVEGGFPRSNVVIRVDPIIPTEKGLLKAYSVIQSAIQLGFTRFRIGLLDMYPHVRKRFEDAGIPDPYSGAYEPSDQMLQATMDMLRRCVVFYQNVEDSNTEPLSSREMMLRLFDSMVNPRGKNRDAIRFETCAEPKLSENTYIVHRGCVSALDLLLLGLDPSDSDAAGYQRKNCLCYSGKTELLECKHRCPHNCLYCYWR